MDSYIKYLKYKSKYIKLKNSNLEGGGKKLKKSNIVNSNLVNQQIEQMDLKPKYIETLSEPWFSLISLGLKTVEGRKNKGRFKEMEVGDIIEFTNNDFNSRSVLTRITRKTEYSTFTEYLETEGLDRCLPGIPDLETGLSVYYKYFTKEDEKEFGVIAINIELVK
jgi:ASC-1-like (ASCH) protein